jgi:PucR C-terminal helix-turn-helix domain
VDAGDRVQAAVDGLAAGLGLPVLVEDPRFRPLWWSAQRDVDGTRLRSILHRSVDPSAAALVVRWGLPTAEGPVRTPAAPEADMVARWCVPLRRDRRLHGYLWISHPDARVTAEQLAGVVACAARATDFLAARHRGADDPVRHRARLLERLARGRDVAAADELAALADLPGDAAVVVCAPGRPGGWPLRGGLSVHAGEPPRPATSGPPVALADLHVAVRRARLVQQALRAGAVLAEPTWTALGSWHLVVAAPDDLAVGDLHPGAETLLALPRPELAETARTVLDAGGDVARAAAALHVHRTTLYYRLDRIRALTGVDLKDGGDRDDLRAALRLAAFRAAAADGW